MPDWRSKSIDLDSFAVSDSSRYLKSRTPPRVVAGGTPTLQSSIGQKCGPGDAEDAGVIPESSANDLGALRGFVECAGV